MADPKKKKNHDEPQVLFPENQAFLDGTLTNPVHSYKVMDEIAARHYISTYHSLGARIGLAIFGVICGLAAMVLSNLAYILVLDLIGEFNLLVLFGWVIFVVFAIIPLGLMFPAGLLALNYRPEKVNALYRDWLKRGHIVRGEIIYSKLERVGLRRIHYRLWLEDGEKISGRISINSGTIPDSSLIKGTPLYILYADKKLHAPL